MNKIMQKNYSCIYRTVRLPNFPTKTLFLPLIRVIREKFQLVKIFMPLTPPSTAATPETAFKRLVTIMDDLRLNCPWDKKQTLESLRHLTIEEVYELSDSILDGDMPEIKKEL